MRSLTPHTDQTRFPPGDLGRVKKLKFQTSDDIFSWRSILYLRNAYVTVQFHWHRISFPIFQLISLLKNSQVKI